MKRGLSVYEKACAILTPKKTKEVKERNQEEEDEKVCSVIIWAIGYYG